jgi:HAD superfamily phosphatase
MNTSVLWQRNHLRLPRPFDSIFFDIDGVLIHTLDSFNATDIAVAEYVSGTLNNLSWGQDEGHHLFTLQDVELFKQAGGYNNDWDLCYLLSALGTARLREWRYASLAERSTAELAELSRTANLRGRGGLIWVRDTFPASSLPDYALIGDLYHEYYWGASELRKRFSREPRFLPDAEGLVHLETLLFPPNLPARLRSSGIRHLGIITGRVGPEVDSALERFEAHSGERWWQMVIPADICPKPDPRALRMAIATCNTRGGLYIGDTADDCDLVRNYHASKTSAEPEILAAMLVQPHEIELYQQRGADLLVRNVEDLLLLLNA